jgi:hypothetical protein
MRVSPRAAVARFAAACWFFYVKEKNGKDGGRAWLADMAGEALDRASGAAEPSIAVRLLAGWELTADARPAPRCGRAGRSPMAKDRLSGTFPLANFLAVNRGLQCARAVGAALRRRMPEGCVRVCG